MPGLAGFGAMRANPRQNATPECETLVLA